MKLPMEVQNPDLNIYLHYFVEMTCEIIIQYPGEIGKQLHHKIYSCWKYLKMVNNMNSPKSKISQFVVVQKVNCIMMIRYEMLNPHYII